MCRSPTACRPSASRLNDWSRGDQQNPGYNHTGTVGALAYWSAQAIREQYLKQPGPLVR